MGLVLRHWQSLLAFGLELGTGVHRQAAGTATESVTLGSVLAAVAIFAVQLVLVLGAVGRVEHLAAHSALEASFVPFVSTGDSFLGGVDRLAALGALGVLSWLERHLGWFSVLELVSQGVEIRTSKGLLHTNTHAHSELFRRLVDVKDFYSPAFTLFYSTLGL